PIPNTEVKPATADGTARETVWESRSLPAVISRSPRASVRGLSCVRHCVYGSAAATQFPCSARTFGALSLIGPLGWPAPGRSAQIGSRRLRLSRRHKRQRHRTEADDVAVVDRRRRFNTPPLDERAVAAVKIL